MEETIKSEYIPKYNHMIELTRKKQNSQEIEKVFIELEKLSPNTELYNIAILFYINKNDIKKAYNYYIKLKSMDSSFKNNDKFENFFKDKKINNKLIINHSLQIILVLVSIFLVTKNLNLKENLETKNKETINLKKEIKIVKDKNEKLANFEEKFLSLAKSEKIAFKNKVEEEKIFTNNELYNLVLKRFKDNKYNEALKISEKIEISQLPEYKAKELIFIKGQAYEKTSQKDLSLKFYKEFLEKYNKPEYLNYIKLTKQKIIKLEKEMQ